MQGGKKNLKLLFFPKSMHAKVNDGRNIWNMLNNSFSKYTNIKTVRFKAVSNEMPT